jgi:glycosyltransferase involved in cell wall biosynthesis
LVDDGSTDDTATIARSFLPSHPSLRVSEIPHGGKAAAIRAGLLASQGSVVAFSDVDLAAPLSYLDHLIANLEGGAQVAIASREGIGARRIGEPFYRHLMGRAFNLLVQLLLLPGIPDTQCGLKAFQSAALHEILDCSTLYRDNDARVVGARVTAFDVELLYIARCLGYRIATVPVIWSAGEHSKVNPIRDTWYNLMDVLKVRWDGWRGRYC